MHESVLKYVVSQRDTLDADTPTPIRVLDVGALDVNGTARVLFPDVEYVGVDLQEGPGVDVVADAHQLDQLNLGTFDVVLCLEMLEHDTRPWLTAAQLAQVVKQGGLVVVTARGNGFPEHDPPDCYRFMKAGFQAVLEAGGLTVEHIQRDPQVPGWFARCTVSQRIENDAGNGGDDVTPKPRSRRKDTAVTGGEG